jgi:transaldolase/glucose-6-phosphate isomerase
VAQKPAARLNELGQSAWLDLIGRKLIAEGELKRLVDEDGVRGVTANPAIFEKAIVESADYDDELKRLAEAGKSPLEIYEAMAIADVRGACDVLRPLFDRGLPGGARAASGKPIQDGFCSLEVSPALALDTRGTVEEAKRFWALVDRPNLFIKIPATREGIPAIREAIAAGISVNITLIFSNRVYLEVIDAYLAGLEERVSKGLPISGIHSVASFFVSRVDTAVDKLLEKKGTDEAKALLGKIAVANAKEAYQVYLKSVAAARWQALEQKGANRQRPLWASTGTKNKAYSDVLYAESLIGPETVNTMPLPTLQAFNDHGKVARTVDANPDEARAQLAALAKAGIDLEKVCTQLTEEGVKLFFDALEKLLHALRARSAAICSARLEKREESFGRRKPEAEKALARARELKAGQRLWARDATLFGKDPAHQKIAADRLGWLDLWNRMRHDAPELASFAKEAARRFDHAVLLGMGGSSLLPDVLARVFGKQPGGLTLRVLDSTAPDAVRGAVAGLDLKRTLFLVASKSGTTTEPDAFYRYYRGLMDGAATHFVAITDEGTPLHQLAKEQGFWRTWVNPPGIGGRYSALSFFGLVPAALLGLDLNRLLDEAERVALSSDGAVPPRDNLAVRLGALAGGLASLPENKADKLTLLLSPSLAPFGAWVEQLVAESTGKSGRGVIPVDGEQPGDAKSYGDDRLFVSLALAGEPADGKDGRVRKLVSAGHPVLRWEVPSKEALAGELVRFEVATAIMGAMLEVDPFDEPDVAASKARTKELLDAAKDGKLAPEEPALRGGGLALFTSTAHANVLRKAAGTLGAAAAAKPSHWVAAHLALAEPGDYLALLAFLPPTDALGATLRTLQARLRDATRLATTVGFGPRYLHSTGQLHKGGPNTGLFFQLTGAGGKDLEIPGKPYSFATLFAAQARADLDILLARGRRALRIHLEDGKPESFIAALDDALKALGK